MPVEVVIPAYNVERTLAAAIDSVLAQTAPVAAIVVVDDGSKDGTRAIIEDYVRRTNGLVKLVAQPNGGLAHARNSGVAATKADLVAFLDSDDTWEPHKVERQLAEMARHPEAVLCYTGLLFVSPAGEPIEVVPPPPCENLRYQLRLGNPLIAPSSTIVRREAYDRAGGFLTGLRVAEDWEFWFRLIAVGPFCAVNEPLTRYTVSTTGLSANADAMYAQGVELLDKFLVADLRGLDRALWRRRILSYQNYKGALTARAAGEHAKEMRYILRSFLFWPNPLWQPHRAKVLAVTLRDRLRRRGRAAR